MNEQPILSNQGINLIKQARIIFTDPDIQAMPDNSPITLIGAPGAGRVIIPFFPGVVMVKTGIGYYNNVDTAETYCVLCFGDDDIEISGYIQSQFVSLLQSNVSTFATPGFYATSPEDVQFTSWNNPIKNSGILDDFVNQSLNLVVENDGPFTEGDPGTTLTISIPYLVYNTITGFYE